MSKELEPVENILQESLISLRASTSKRDKSVSSLPGFFNASDLEQLDQKLDLEFDSFMLQYIMGLPTILIIQIQIQEIHII